LQAREEIVLSIALAQHLFKGKIDRLMNTDWRLTIVKSKIESRKHVPAEAGIENVKGDFSCKRAKPAFHGVRS
jgi:hypothetical protein